MWLEGHQELARHPKTKRLSRLLNISLPTTVGHLFFLWWWAMDYAADGSLSRYEAADISDAAMWEGEPETFVSGLLTAGWLDQQDDGLHIHDWKDYAGKLLERRRKDLERKRNSNTLPKEFQRNSNGIPTEVARYNTVHNSTRHNNTYPPIIPPKGGGDGVVDDVDVKPNPQKERFEKFWKAYPKKVGKKDALKAFERAKPTAELLSKMLKAIEAAKTTPQWTKDNGQYIPNPSTWLNQGRWDDEPTVTINSADKDYSGWEDDGI